MLGGGRYMVDALARYGQTWRIEYVVGSQAQAENGVVLEDGPGSAVMSFREIDALT